MSRRAKFILLDLSARLCATLPPLLVAMRCFPVWVKRSPAATLSGIGVIVALFCLIPFWKRLFQSAGKLTETSMPIAWAVLLGLLLGLRSILDQMLVITLVGLLGSLGSMALCGLRNRYRDGKECR